MTDLVIVGGGIIGCSVALRVRDVVDSVTIVDPNELCSQTSSAAIGGIGASQTDGPYGGPVGLAVESRRMYPDWLARIESLSGVNVPFLHAGMMEVFFTEEQRTELFETVIPQWRKYGYPVEEVDAAWVRNAEPLLSETIGGIYADDEGALEARTLATAVRTAVERDDKIVVNHGEVLSLESHGDHVTVTLDSGEIFTADYCVMAAGVRSGQVAPIAEAETFGAKGQVLEFRVPGATTYPLNYHTHAKPGDLAIPITTYLVPRFDGRVTVGVTYERDVLDTETTDFGRHEIMRGAALLCPSLMEWTLERHWAGVRPGTSDGHPFIGPIDDNGRVIAANGHYGAGLTLTPVTAELVAFCLFGGELSPAQAEGLRECDPHRFANA